MSRGRPPVAPAEGMGEAFADGAFWHDEHGPDHRRRIQTGMLVSLAMHGLLVAVFATAPPPPVATFPEYVSVELVAAPPGSGQTSPSPSNPPSRAASRPAPAPPPVPEAPPAPPIAKAPVQVLPEETPGRIRKAPPKPPEQLAKVKPEPKPAAPPRRRRREKAVSYEDAMAALNEELGGDETSDLLAPAPQARPDAETEGVADGTEGSAGTARVGVTVSPEQRAWDLAVRQRISAKFPIPARARGRGLVTSVEIEITASGALRGEPRLVGSSGDLDFDRWALSAVRLAAPLPAPPEPGVRRLNLNSEER